MTDEERQELSGKHYAYELLLTALLQDLIHRTPDKGQDTEHLEAWLRDLAVSFAGQATQMSAAAQSAADATVQKILRASLARKYGKT